MGATADMRDEQEMRLPARREALQRMLRLAYAHAPRVKDGTALGILLVPGSGFSTLGGLKNYMRASFSMATPEQIEEGMGRAKMIANERTRTSSG